MMGYRIENIRDFLPDTLDVAYFRLYPQFSFGTDLSCNLFHLSGEYGQLIDHVVDGVDQAQHLPRDGYTSDFLRQISTSHGGLIKRKQNWHFSNIRAQFL